MATVMLLALGHAAVSLHPLAPPPPPPAFPIPDGTQLQLLPCASNLPRMRIHLLRDTSNLPTATYLQVAGAGNSSCASCPGENGKGTAPCHTWNCPNIELAKGDRNDMFMINTSLSAPFLINTYPQTAAAPTGAGLMAPGQCLLPASGSGAFGDSVHASATGCEANGLWSYDPAAQQLKHNTSGMCLDAGSAVSLNCWSPSSPTFGYPMCDPNLDPEERAKDLVSRMTVEEKGHNAGGAGGWGGSAGVARLGVVSKMALQSSEALHGLVQAGCVKDRYFYKEFGKNNTGCPASFPHALALGSTFNRSLWGMIGDRISTEARAVWNDGTSSALWLWA